MNEYTGLDPTDVQPDDNVVVALIENARRHPERAALAYREGDEFVDVSTADFVATVRGLAKGLIGLGVRPGDRVCIFMPSRIEFTYLDYAIWFAGATTVTVYETSSPDQIEWIVGNSGAVALVTSTSELARRYHGVADRLPECRHVYVVDDGGLDTLVEAGADVTDAALQERVDGIAHDQLATLVYTSGTTGRPKGCMVTHGNLIWEVRQVVGKMDELFHAGGSTLMFLPLAHILARIVQVGCVTQGVKIGFSTGVARLVPELAILRPNSPPRGRAARGSAARSSTGPSTSRSATRRSRSPERSAGTSASSVRSSTDSSTRSCARRSAATSNSPSPAAPRWANDSDTSSTGPGSWSSRDTASPRPPRPRPSTRPTSS